MCCGWLGLRDPRIDTFGLFMYDLGDMDGEEPNPATKDLIRTPRALRNEDFLGDVIVQRAKQKRKFKLVLKKKIFLPQHNGRGSDLFFERLVYLQGEDDVIIQGMVDVDTEEKAIALAGISMAVAFGEAMGYSSDDLVEANVQNFVVPKFRSKRPATEWASFVYELREQLVKADSGDLQDQFLQIVQSSPTYGMHWFYVYKIDSSSLSDKLKSAPLELLLGFNADGLNVYDRSQNMLSSYPYADIQNWNGTSAQFNMTLTEAGKQFEFSVVTGQALDMAGLILDYIKIMMTEQDPTSAQ
jgi:hypothetical protein